MHFKGKKLWKNIHHKGMICRYYFQLVLITCDDADVLFCRSGVVVEITVVSGNSDIRSSFFSLSFSFSIFNLRKKNKELR